MPVSAPIKRIAAVANEKGLPVYNLDASWAYVQASPEVEIFIRLPSSCGEPSGKVVFLNASTD